MTATTGLFAVVVVVGLFGHRCRRGWSRNGFVDVLMSEMYRVDAQMDGRVEYKQHHC